MDEDGRLAGGAGPPPQGLGTPASSRRCPDRIAASVDHLSARECLYRYRRRRRDARSHRIPAERAGRVSAAAACSARTADTGHRRLRGARRLPHRRPGHQFSRNRRPLVRALSLPEMDAITAAYERTRREAARLRSTPPWRGLRAGAVPAAARGHGARRVPGCSRASSRSPVRGRGSEQTAAGARATSPNANASRPRATTRGRDSCTARSRG